MKKFSPRKPQTLIHNFILKHQRCAIWASMGIGKTAACLMAADSLLMWEDLKILIVAPKRVALDVWPKEPGKWEEFFGLSVSPVLGTAKQRIAALKKKAAIYTINYENLPWLLKTVGRQWPWDTIIADESTKLKSFRTRGGGKQAKALAKMAWTKVRYFIELTGTPSPNGLIDLWGQLWFIDKGARLGRTFTEFKERYFHLKHPNSFEWIINEGAAEEIMAKVQDICLSIRAEDYFDLDDPIINTISVSIPATALKQYKELEKEMFTEIQGKEVEANFAAAKSIKCLQVANGAVYHDKESNWVPVHNAKLEAVESIINEWNGENIIIAYHFKTDLIRLQSRFPHGKDIKDINIDDWNTGKIPLLFAHPQSAGHGLNLQYGGRILVFYGHWWSTEHYDQIVERIGPMRQMQAGLNRNVFLYNIIAENTIDELVVQRRHDKRAVQDLLLEYANRK